MTLTPFSSIVQCAAVRITLGAITLPVQLALRPLRTSQLSVVVPPEVILVTVLPVWFAVKTLPAESIAIATGPSPVAAKVLTTPAEVIFVTVFAPEFAV